jgi:predicted ATP-grasp superfamily ATP-dependent carboligase
MKVWITKYALSEGIEEHDVTDCGEGMMLTANRYFHGEGRDWHRTRESAVTKAEKMRKSKIASLRKQIERLEKLAFE